MNSTDRRHRRCYSRRPLDRARRLATSGEGHRSCLCIVIDNSDGPAGSKPSHLGFLRVQSGRAQRLPQGFTGERRLFELFARLVPPSIPPARLRLE